MSTPSIAREMGARALGRGARVAWRRLPGDVREAIRGVVTSSDDAPGARAPGDEPPAYRFAPPGHYLSPIPSLDDVKREEQRLFGHYPRELAGIALNEAAQLSLLDRLRPYYAEQPFPEKKDAARRYFFDNPAYSYSDAILLYCMIRYLKPRRITEIGSGYSSCLTLDTNELFFDDRIACTFVDPFPDTLLSLIRPQDRSRIEIIPARLQDVDPSRFSTLEENDILFVDSTHVDKIGSDVTHLFFEVLPVLRPGVYVHLHDIFHPFEYPSAWIYEGRAWTEAYLLRAFLTFNSTFEIVLFNTFLEHFHRERFARDFPLCLRNEGGSIWLRRTGTS